MNQVLPPELSERVRRHSDEALVLVLEAFRAGRFATAQEIGAYCQGLLAELESHYDSLTPDAIAGLEDQYGDAGASPVIDAYFGGSADVAERIKSKLRQLGWRERA